MTTKNIGVRAYVRPDLYECLKQFMEAMHIHSQSQAINEILEKFFLSEINSNKQEAIVSESFSIELVKEIVRIAITEALCQLEERLANLEEKVERLLVSGSSSLPNDLPSSTSVSADDRLSQIQASTQSSLPHDLPCNPPPLDEAKQLDQTSPISNLYNDLPSITLALDESQQPAQASRVSNLPGDLPSEPLSQDGNQQLQTPVSSLPNDLPSITLALDENQQLDQASKVSSLPGGQPSEPLSQDDNHQPLPQLSRGSRLPEDQLGDIPQPDDRKHQLQASGSSSLPSGKPSGTLPTKNGLTQTQLANRLGLHTSNLGRKRSKMDKVSFAQWSRELDPDQLGWRFDKRTKKYLIVE
jgi:hypothetical protein